VNLARRSLADGVGFPPLTPVVRVLLITLVASHLVLFAIGLAAPKVAAALTLFLALDHGAWFEAPLFLPLWQLVTVVLVHGGLWHLFGNCLFLYFFGTMVEGIVGPRRFAVLFGLGTVVASLLSLLLMGFVAPNAVTMGASGGVMAIVVAAATFQPFATVLFIFIPLPLWVMAAGYVLFDILPAIEALAGVARDRTDHFAHLGGALLGFLAVKRGFVWIDWQERVQRAVAERQERSAADDEAELDRILARVGKEGIHALDGRERAFLKRMSERKAKGSR
jgi:membrane associated rhomboid family serine protease